MNGHISDPSLAGKGKRRIEWAEREMPVLREIKKQFEKDRPLEGERIAACLHVTTETANLMYTLKAGGAQVALCASNPLSTQDDVAAALVSDGIPVYAIKGEDTATYYSHVRDTLRLFPTISMDDGADIVSTLTALHHGNSGSVHPVVLEWFNGLPEEQKKALTENMLGSTEETTTGVIRLRAMARDGVLPFPVIAVNDALTKHLFDNQYGTGQSTMDGVLRATNILLAGRIVVVSGYGWCGRGVASRANGMGARVIVTEVDPIRALEASMDGYQVMPMIRAATIGDLFITVTGDKDVLRREHFEVMKDGAIVANSGHFDVEINIGDLKEISESSYEAREYVTGFRLSGSRTVFLLGDGRLINLAAAEGHPAMVMDMSFANQALSARYLKDHGADLGKDVFPVPSELDRNIAALKLKTLDIGIDTLTDIQETYLKSWKEGT